MNFVFAAQMYGAGKTRLGIEFLNQINHYLDRDHDHEVFERHCPLSYKKEVKELTRIIPEFRDASRVYILLTGDMNTVEKFLESIQYKSLTDFILDMCDVAEKPVFFHFDELGVFDVVQLRLMRDSCLHSLISMERYASNFPLFFFSGRGAAYNELGSETSSIGSHWLILEPLQVPHVVTIMLKSCPCFELAKSVGKDQRESLASHIICWTGGAPRPLLYTLSMLDALKECHGYHYTEEGGLIKVFDALIKFVNENERLLAELGPISCTNNKLKVDEKEAYLYFCLCSYFGICISPEETIGDAGRKASMYLRSFNIFASPVGDKIRIITPQFVHRIVMARKMAIKDILKFRKVQFSRSELMEEVVAYLACLWNSTNVADPTIPLFPHIIPQKLTQLYMLKCILWKNRGPVIANNGNLTIPDIDTIVAERSIGNNTKKLSKDNLGYFCQKLALGDVVVTGKKSAAADIIIKLAENMVIEIQCKSGEQILNCQDVQREVMKSVAKISKGFRSIFVMLVASGINYDHTRETIQESRIHVVVPSSSQLESFMGEENLRYFQRNDLLPTL